MLISGFVSFADEMIVNVPLPGIATMFPLVFVLPITMFVSSVISAIVIV